MTEAIQIIQTVIIGLGDMLMCLGALTFIWLVAGEDGL